MMNLIFNILSGFFLISLLVSCDQLQSNNDEASELSHPLTIKGMQLGLDFDTQLKLGEKNGICKNDLPEEKVCQYKITESVYARPELHYSLYNGNRVLSGIKLILNSPFNFPVVINGIDNVKDAEYPSLKKIEITEIIELYNNKYGIGEQEEWENGGTVEWNVGDMHITLEYVTTMYANAYQIHPQIKWAFLDDAYSTTVSYEYSDNMKHLLKDEATHESEPIGDNI